MAEVGNLETIYSALKALSLLRTNVSDVFKYLINSSQSSNVSVESEQSQTNSINTSELITLVDHIKTRFRELETACTLLCPLIQTINLGNTHMIGQDLNYDKSSLYPDMIISYRWLDNIQEYSSVAFQAMQSKFTKRNSMSKSRHRHANSQRNLNNHNILPQSIDYFVSAWQRTFEMSIEIARPFGVFTILKITLEKTLRAVIVLRGFVIEWVLIKGFDETFEEINLNNLTRYEKKLRHSYGNNVNDTNLDDIMDIWTPSRYKIFHTITDHANAAILHFYAPFQMENAIKAYLNWLRSYATLFSAVCRKCDSRLLNSKPPTWRDFRTNEPYHFECRP